MREGERYFISFHLITNELHNNKVVDIHSSGT